MAFQTHIQDIHPILILPIIGRRPYINIRRKGVVSKISFNILWGVGTMRKKRFQFGDRRQNEVMPRFPFKDSNGATITQCRRKIPGRRMNRIQGKWIDELVNS